MKEEFFDITFRKKLYHSLEELQIDADHWIKHYNEERPHSGKYCYGKTPWDTFQNTKPLALQKNLDAVCEISDSFISTDIAAC